MEIVQRFFSRGLIVLCALLLTLPLNAAAKSDDLERARHYFLSRQYQQATPVYLQLARQGVVEAQWMMSQLYRQGLGTDIDKDKSGYWLQQAAKGGHSKAMYQLGMAYLNGEGLPQDISKASQWLNAAAEKGVWQAKKKLELMSKPTSPLTELSYRAVEKSCRKNTLDQLPEVNDKMIRLRSSRGRTALWPAVSHHHFGLAKALLKKGLDVDLQDNDGQSVLADRVQAEDWQAVDWLLKQGARSDIQDKFGNTVLHLASAIKWRRQFTALIKASHRLNQQNNQGETILDRARVAGQSQWVKALLKAGAVANTTKSHNRSYSFEAIAAAATKNNLPVLHMAVQLGSMSGVQHFYNEEQMITRDREGLTPSGRAVTAGHQKILAWLLQRYQPSGKELNQLLELAIKGNLESIAIMLVPKINDTEALMSGFQLAQKPVQAGGKKLDRLTELLFKKLKSARSADRWLLDLCAHGQFDLASRLLPGISRVVEKDSQGRTAIWYALSSRQWSLAAELMKKGAQPLNMDKQGETGLTAAIATMTDVDVKSVKRIGLDLKQKNRDGLGLLTLAVIRQQVSLAKALLSAGLDVNDRDGFGSTPLMHAVQVGNKVLVSLLLNQGADARLRNRNKQTAINMAKSMGRKDLLALMEKQSGSLFF